MSTTDMGALRRDLLLEQAIDCHAAKLVQLATEAVLQLQRTDMKTSQLRNAVNVANEDGSFDVIANFIRYKIATQPKSWGRETNSFGHTVIKHLQTKVREEAEKAHSELLSQLEGEDQDHLKEQIYRAMMRRYFGYAVRAFAYYEKAEKGDEKAKALQILQEAANVK